MPTDFGNLMDQVYDLLTQSYAASRTDQSFLAFEPLGRPITDGTFKFSPTDNGPSDAVAVERVSEWANKLPTFQNGFVNWGLGTVDGTIEILLDASMPLSPSSMAGLGAAKQAAHGKFDATLGSMTGVPGDRFHPIYATPGDWYVSSTAANWTSHQIGQDAGTPPPPPRGIKFEPPVWRVLPLQARPALQQAATASHPFLALASSLQTASMPVKAVGAVHFDAPVSRNISAFSVRTSPVLSTSAVLSRRAAAPVATAGPATARLSFVEASQVVLAATTAQPVTSNNLEISFDHCIVTCERHWWPDEMFTLPNWYLPGLPSGHYSHCTGIEDAGTMPAVATGFVVIRNLKIHGQWTAADRGNIEGSVSVGPFSLTGSGYDSGSETLSCPGMQIVGWFFTAVPMLPPASDPAMPSGTESPKPTAVQPQSPSDPAVASSAGGGTVPTGTSTSTSSAVQGSDTAAGSSPAAPSTPGAAPGTASPSAPAGPAAIGSVSQ